jgi:hypothetical protein
MHDGGARVLFNKQKRCPCPHPESNIDSKTGVIAEIYYKDFYKA